MDYHQESVFPGGNDVKLLASNSGNSGSNNAPMKFDMGLPQSASGEEPPMKKSRMEEACRRRAIAKMLYKTKLCSRFRSGPCVADCCFAHGKEELRKPPPNWKEIVAAREEELRKHRKEIIAAQEEDEAVSVEPEDRCTFVHDEQAKARGSDAITSVGNMPLYCKTRVCSKWEMTGYCPFQNRCHFAHGVQELRVVHGESESATTPTEAKQDVLPPTEAVVGGEKRSRKERMREIISILQSIIPGGKDKDVEEVIDEAIEYLQSLKVKAKDLGFDTLQPSLKASANGNIS